MTNFEKQQRETEEMIRRWYDAEVPSSEARIMAIFNGKNKTKQGATEC
jgi:hypothetical protein